jgi:DNA-directed RNA polymerase specialized sigma24 family protein
VSEHYHRLYRWFFWLTNAADDAADLTHDTFVALWESVDRFDDPSAGNTRPKCCQLLSGRW